jgi:hypothetical protein
LPERKKRTKPGEFTVTVKVVTMPLYAVPEILGGDVVEDSLRLLTTMANILDRAFPTESVVVSEML